VEAAATRRRLCMRHPIISSSIAGFVCSTMSILAYYQGAGFVCSTLSLCVSPLTVVRL
jgi:hypothetical protein